MFTKMGELLVRYGELSQEELEVILFEQRRKYRPFGRIAADMFGIHETAIWRAWSEQYAKYCPRVELDHQHQDLSVCSILSPDAAWQHRVLPLRFQDGDLILVTSEERLPVALNYVDTHIKHSNIMWLTGNVHLETALMETYPVLVNPSRRTAV